MAFPYGCLKHAPPPFLAEHSLSLGQKKKTKFSWRKGGRKLTAKGPLRATKFFLTEFMAMSGIAVLPSLRIGVTSTSSHSIGVCAKFVSRLSHGIRLRGTPSRQRVELYCLGGRETRCMRTLAAAKISFTLLEISGPMPSPSMNVTV